MSSQAQRRSSGGGRGAGPSKATGKKDQGESIYQIGGTVAGFPPATPIVKTYNVAPNPGSPTGTGKTRMHEDSSQIQHIMNPVSGPRDAQMRQGIKPLNHAKSNAQAVKEASQLNALRKAAADAQQKARPPGYTPAYNRTLSAPSLRPPTMATAVPPNGRNFMQENKLGVGAAVKPMKPKEDELKYLNKQDYGRVPTYLLERKIELAAQHEAEERMKEAALIPPGMRMLPEEERLETLGILAKNKQEVERALQSLPLRIETPSAIRRKEDLERRLSEIEDATKIFQRPRVLVHL